MKCCCCNSNGKTLRISWRILRIITTSNLLDEVWLHIPSASCCNIHKEAHWFNLSYQTAPSWDKLNIRSLQRWILAFRSSFRHEDSGHDTLTDNLHVGAFNKSFQIQRYFTCLECCHHLGEASMLSICDITKGPFWELHGYFFVLFCCFSFESNVLKKQDCCKMVNI